MIRDSNGVSEIWRSIFSKAVTVSELLEFAELCLDTERCRGKVPTCSTPELFESCDDSAVETLGLSSTESDIDL